MYDSFFTGPTYLYDVKETLSRSASALLDKGIKLMGGESASTDGKETIYLPHAMRRYLSFNEIDFVRYLVLHEMAHIEHSEPKDHVLDHIVSHPEAPAILNCLEDLRIEAIEGKQMFGYNSIIATGRRIVCDMWRSQMKGLESSDCTLRQALVHAIYMVGIDSEFRNPTGIKIVDAVMERLDGAGLYPKIHSVTSDPPDSTYELADLATAIIEAICELSEKQTNHKEAEPRTTTSDQWGDGAHEKLSEQLCDTNIGDEKQEEIGYGEFSKTGKGLSVGMSDDRNFKTADAIENFKWAQHAVAFAGPLVNALRGESRCGYTTPQDSGIRIAQNMVPAFLNGSTNRILRRRSRSPHQGTSVVFLVDDSGSMHGEREFNLEKFAWRGAAMLGLACERAKIRVMIARYSNETFIDKNFGDTMVRRRTKMCGGLRGGTYVGTAIELAENYLEAERNPRRVIFLLTDGETYDHRQDVKRIRNKRIEFYPILFGVDAIRTSLVGGVWDVPGVVRINDPHKVNLGAELVSKLCSVI